MWSLAWFLIWPQQRGHKATVVDRREHSSRRIELDGVRDDETRDGGRKLFGLLQVQPVVATLEHDAFARGDELADRRGALHREAARVRAVQVQARHGDEREDGAPVPLCVVGHELAQVLRVALERLLREHLHQGRVNGLGKAALGIALGKGRHVAHGVLDVEKAGGVVDALGAILPIGEDPLAGRLVDEDTAAERCVRVQLDVRPDDGAAEGGAHHNRLLQLQLDDELVQVGGQPRDVEPVARLVRIAVEAQVVSNDLAVALTTKQLDGVVKISVRA
mmetsp:Transcript_56018/g.111200  ORF Transcript_56018/g.111200 Transcript_56018/m.111200 type:complete len:277 (-) Transcript_56018:166-996(-)